MAPFMLILLAAVSVNEFALVQLNGSTTVILPRPVPLGFVVVTTTLEVLNAVVRFPVVSNESNTLPDD